MKSFYLICFVVVNCAYALENDRYLNIKLSTLQNLKTNQLPQVFIDRIFRNSKDASHWCCPNPVKPGDTLPRTRLSYREVSSQQSFAHKYYRGCGFLGLKRCERYETRYRVQRTTVSYIETYQVPDHRECRVEPVCCPGFVNIAGSCLDKDFVDSNADTLIDIVNEITVG